MSSLRNYFFRLTNTTPERKASRAHLKLAKTGDSEAYLRLSSKYIELALIYFGGCLRENTSTRFSRVEQVFSALWQHLPYAERVSDFEYMLGKALMDNAPNDGCINSPEALVTKIRLLEPRTRLALITYEFEKWPLHWVSLLMRMRPHGLHAMLSQARCELCGISWESLAEEERQCLEAISVSMDKSPDLRANKILCCRIATYPRVLEIKAQWLELRAELVEIRHRYIPETSECEKLMGKILNAIQTTPMNQPPLVDRVVNSVHFARPAKIKVS
jgi:hypothetical protein